MNIYNRIVNWYFTKNAMPYWCVLLIDSIVCFLSGVLVFWLYYRGSVVSENIVGLTGTLLLFNLCNLIAFRWFRTYSGILRYSSFVDLRKMAQAMAVSCVIALTLHYGFIFMHYSVPEGFVLLTGRQIVAMYIIATIGTWLLRVLAKNLHDVAFGNKDAMRTMIYGVKEGGVGLAKNILTQKPARFVLKGFITHDDSLNGKMLMGEHVFQVNQELRSYIYEHDIQAVLVSPLQTDVFRKDETLQNLLIEAGVKIFMASQSEEWKGDDRFDPNRLHEVQIEDLLPRDQIQVDMDAIGNLLRDKKILLTGSAGSIGSEILRQISDYHPAELVLVDIAETPQHDIRLMMSKRWPEIKTRTIVGSIGNYSRMEQIFREFRPDYVFHAAAYKHVPMMEDNPSEAIQNNVWGTKVIADLSVKYGVKKFVMLSTDKAVNPTNVMGCSKRICEIYVQSLNHYIRKQAAEGQTVTQFVTTRFGNVLGSNGSVIPLFEKQIKAGGPVTVTDPNIIRFFMLIPEACKLVLEAGTHGQGGEIFVFDMGQPVRIADLAYRMIKLSGAKGVEVKFTGLRPGEKLYEEVLSTQENTIPSFHSKIRIATVREYDYEEVNKEIQELVEASNTYDDMAIVAKMKSIVPEYKSNNSVYSVLDK
ncbi:MAG: nucleoside-diphosphate sugar epimerase/dehydratase [Prevotellaceae bacterium]|nr:nucleoside-diphosphate sugar epimerase/dehydratase [Prevotellaceae bacterium]